MKGKRLLLLFVSTCLILALAVSPFMAACAAPAEPGAAEIAALEKEIAALEKKVTAAEKGKTTSEKEVAALEKEVAAVEKEIAAAEKEIAKLEVAAPEPVKTWKWRIQSGQVEGTPTIRMWHAVMKPLVTELSDGRIDITMYTGNAIVASKEVPGAVSTGVLDMALSGAGYYTGTIGPASKFFAGGLFMWETYNEWATLWYDLGIADIARKAYADAGVHMIGSGLGTPNCGFFISTVPITCLADLEGLKVRCYGMMSNLLDKIGIATCYITPGEIYTSLATGVIDAAVFGNTAYNLPYGLYEVAKYTTFPAVYSTSNDVQINPSRWEELPTNLQKVLEIATREWDFANQRIHQYEETDAILMVQEEFGVTVNTLPDEEVAELRAAAMEVWDDVAGDDPLALEIVEICREFLKHQGRL